MSEMEKMILADSPVTLRVVYGNDQMPAIDKLINEFQQQGRILEFRKRPDSEREYTAYAIDFADLYSVYLFGHKSASLFEYLFK